MRFNEFFDGDLNSHFKKFLGEGETADDKGLDKLEQVLVFHALLTRAHFVQQSRGLVHPHLEPVDGDAVPPVLLLYHAQYSHVLDVSQQVPCFLAPQLAVEAVADLAPLLTFQCRGARSRRTEAGNFPALSLELAVASFLSDVPRDFQESSDHSSSEISSPSTVDSMPVGNRGTSREQLLRREAYLGPSSR
ncbi:hypothetical protein HPB49_021308 [Dermacentor silvarum]|uniref:Uncharacterized protein n=1 Tax=Dermacentor silvarum TaxID=543639 RepID=A0ACB8CH91_DERSI|nr:hypothetical protein HPB49_021308 [Dermacentor silvarum]